MIKVSYFLIVTFFLSFSTLSSAGETSTGATSSGTSNPQQLKKAPSSQVGQTKPKPSDTASKPAAKPTGEMKTNKAIPLVPKPPKKHRPNIHFDCASITCISQVRVKPKGTRSLFEVITTQPARIFVEVGLMKPVNHKFSRVERAIFTLQNRISSNTQITGLNPNRTYYYVVKAKGKDGIIQWSEGAFSTSGRKVDVVIENIHVIGDGDGGINDPGDFIFQFKVMGHKYVVRTLMHSGAVKAVNKTISVTGVPPNLEIKLNLLEHDGVIDFSNMGDGLGEDYVGTYNVETSGEQETRNFSLKAANGEYNVVVSGKLNIYY